MICGTCLKAEGRPLRARLQEAQAREPSPDLARILADLNAGVDMIECDRCFDETLFVLDLVKRKPGQTELQIAKALLKFRQQRDRGG